jgi:GntR family transcriptional regulator, transcriptional repressor for pyruvate dehydrogenase complex
MGRDSGDQHPELSLRRVAPTRAHDEVARQLRALMERGVLRPGDQLPPERDLAARFGVSRATVRQALSALQSAGLVESLVGRGTFARADGATASVTGLVEALRMAQGTLSDQLDVRRLIEPQVAREAAIRAQPDDLAFIRESIARQETRAARRQPFVEEDSAFHLAIARATGNPLLAKMVEGIHGLLRESRERSLATEEGVRFSLEGHRRIAAALLDGDGQAAYDAMVAHLLDVERLSLQGMASKAPPRKDGGAT